MKTTRLPGQEGLDEIIDGLYAASVGEQSFDTALEAVSGPVQAHITLLALRGTNGEDYPVRVVPKQPPGKVVSFDALGMRQLVRNSEFYNDFAAPHGAEESVFLWSPVGDGKGMAFAVHREERFGPFHADETAFLQRVAPHIVRASRLWLAGAGLRERWTLDAMDALDCGVLRLRPDGLVLWMNRAASRMLERGDGLRLEGQRLVALHREDSDRLRHMLARPRAHGSDPLAVRCRGTGGYDVLVVPPDQANKRREGCTVIVTPRGKLPDSTKAWLRTRFRLTVSESKVVELLARGLSVTEISDVLQAAQGTTRNHLKRAMAKTETRRQVDLVRLVLLRWEDDPPDDRLTT